MLISRDNLTNYRPALSSSGLYIYYVDRSNCLKMVDVERESATEQLCENHVARQYSKDKEKFDKDIASGKLDSVLYRIPGEPENVRVMVDRDSTRSEKELLALLYRYKDSTLINVKVFDVGSRVMLQCFTVMPPPGFDWVILMLTTRTGKTVICH